jgi:hypothetical protein
MAQRGLFLQLLVECKRQLDDGYVRVRDRAALGSLGGCDRKTSGKSLGILAEKSLCTYEENGSGGIVIHIPNYLEWQGIDVKGVREKSRKNPTKIPPLRPDKIRPDKTNIYIRDLFNEACKSLPKIRTWRGNRIRTVKKRAEENPELDWSDFFKKVEDSDFLTGRGENKWSATFDWLMKAANFDKVLEGNYDGRKPIRKVESGYTGPISV